MSSDSFLFLIENSVLENAADPSEDPDDQE